MTLLEQVDLGPLNTLALPAHARYFAALEQAGQLPELLSWAQAKSLPTLVLGGGSNLILRGDWPGLALHMALRGKRVERIPGGALVRVAAGENWHELVQWSLGQGLYGLENLTLIPGTAGAAPIQNIGAYGVELADNLHSVRGWSLDENRELEIAAADCALAYRDSVFKNALRGRFIVTEITLRLRDNFAPVLTYPALASALEGISQPSAEQVERAVRELRRSKLPDPAALPNVGSFFKNPVIDAARFAELRAHYPQIPSFAAAAGVKVPAAWLVDQCGWKGMRRGAVGVHTQQALVLIHYGGGSGEQLLALAGDIARDVSARFGIALELEPTVYGAA